MIIRIFSTNLLFVKDLSAGVDDISSFFGFSLTPDQVQRIAEGSTFSAMKKSAGNSNAAIGNVIYRKGGKAPLQVHASVTKVKIRGFMMCVHVHAQVRSVTGRTTSRLNKAKRWMRSSRSTWQTPNWEQNSTTRSSVSRKTPAAPPDSDLQHQHQLCKPT